MAKRNRRDSAQRATPSLRETVDPNESQIQGKDPQATRGRRGRETDKKGQQRQKEGRTEERRQRAHTKQQERRGHQRDRRPQPLNATKEDLRRAMTWERAEKRNRHRKEPDTITR